MSSAARPQIDLVGTCACGAASVSAHGTVRSMFLCACEDCQRMTGTGHAAAILMHAADVALVGETLASAAKADSGAVMTRRVCSRCGTPLWAQSSRATGLATLPVGLFGNDAAGWFRPRHLLFARSLRAWDHIDPQLPRYATYPPRDSAA